jgi:hypothetical protein
MANLKKLIGNALNKANSSKPSNDGPASTKTSRPASIQAAVDERNKKQDLWNKEAKRQGGLRGMKENDNKDFLGYSYNPSKYEGPTASDKTVYSPAYKEERAKEIKRVTSPGGLVKEIKSGKQTLKQKTKFKRIL